MNKFLLLFLCLFPITGNAKIERSQATKDLFKQNHPCPQMAIITVLVMAM